MTAVTSPADLANSLRLSITRLARRMRQESDARLTPTQIAALATVDRHGPLPLGALAEEEQIGAPTVTKIVDKLHAAGLVERLPDPDDRRVTRIAATPSGRTLLDEIRERKTAWLATRLAELDAEDLATLTAAAEVLERLAAAPKPATPRDHEADAP